MGTIEKRFQQKGYHMLQKMERILTDEKVTIDNQTLLEVTQFYDPCTDRLYTQLVALHQNESSLSDLQSVFSFLKSLNTVEKQYYSDVVKVAKLILVMPATNAVSERSFSSLRRIKTWLRNTINQVRLNHCMTLHVQKQMQ